MNKQIKRFKIYFTAIITGLIVLSIFVGVTLQNTSYLTTNYLMGGFETLKYRIDYAGNFKDFVAQAPQAFNNKIQYQRTNTPSIPVLVYHGIPNESDNSPINITVDDFKKHIFALKQAGYTTITTDQLLSYFQGKINLPDKSIMITFDDGRVDSFKMADPLLNALGYKAVMFVIGRYPLSNERQSYYLSLDQLKEMNANGRWDIEAHSYDGHTTYYTSPLEQNGHFFSHKIWLLDKNRLETDQEFETRITSDLSKVKYDLGKALGKTIHSFAFPYGDYGQNSTNFSQSKEITLKNTKDLYSLAFYQKAPEIYFTSNYFIPQNKDNSFFLVHRININPRWSGDDLLATLDKSKAKTLPYTDDFSKDKGWIKIWSSLSLHENMFDLHADPEQTGASALLDGSRLWENYLLTATANSPQQQGVYVWVRFQDENNNTSCNFGKNFIHIEQTINGVKRVIQGTIFKTTIIPKEDFSIKVQVKDRTITCTLNDSISVKSEFLDENLSSGGIGFKTWENVVGQSSLTLKDLHVVEI